ncbi:MAG: hypothetical protein KGH72_02305 [Candidatus Micrarchaeota archaeon]|nr:hypothetical protein [Candidatus Micrarchaeota archaeon]
MSNQSVVTAKRALSLGKIYVALTVLMFFIALIAWNFNLYVTPSSQANVTASNETSNVMTANAAAGKAALAAGSFSGIGLLTVPLDVLPMLLTVSPIVILFVYDKNNGVLEYLLSLGMTQRDIYMRYLGGAMLLAVVFLAFFVPADLAYSYLLYGADGAYRTALILGPVALIGLSGMAFMITMMMIFSSLQKTRAGSNQPMATMVGMATTLPAYATAFAFSYQDALMADIAVGVVLAIIAIILLLMSGKLIKREKFLP